MSLQCPCNVPAMSPEIVLGLPVQSTLWMIAQISGQRIQSNRAGVAVSRPYRTSSVRDRVSARGNPVANGMAILSVPGRGPYPKPSPDARERSGQRKLSAADRSSAKGAEVRSAAGKPQEDRGNADKRNSPVTERHAFPAAEGCEFPRP